MSEESRLKINVTVDGAFVKDVVHNILSHDTREEYTVNSDVDGVSIITLPIGAYTITSTYTRENVIYDSQINTVTVKSPYESFINIVDVSLSSCHDSLLNKSCKYFHHEPYMTPNNFDFYFDYNNIPVNIITESPSELHKRLQACLPLDKILHLNLDKGSDEYGNTLHIYNKLSLNYKSRIIGENDTNNFTPKIICDWNDDLILDYLFKIEEYNIKELLEYESEELDLPYVLEDDTMSNLVSDVYYKNLSDVLDVELSNFFDTVFGILDLSASEIRRIGREHIDDPDDATDGELSIAGADFIISVRDDFITTCEDIFMESIFDFHRDISVNFYKNNVMVYNNITLNDGDSYVTVEDNGVSYYKGFLNVLLLTYDSEGNVDDPEEIGATYTNGSFNLPSELDGGFLTVYTIYKKDNGELEFKLNNYSIDFDEYRFYSCENCGRVVYSDVAIVSCSECDNTDITVSDMPYHVYLEDYWSDYYTNEHLQIM